VLRAIWRREMKNEKNEIFSVVFPRKNPSLSSNLKNKDKLFQVNLKVDRCLSAPWGWGHICFIEQCIVSQTVCDIRYYLPCARLVLNRWTNDVLWYCLNLQTRNHRLSEFKLLGQNLIPCKLFMIFPHLEKRLTTAPDRKIHYLLCAFDLIWIDV
jgi:hypothetical protein